MNNLISYYKWKLNLLIEYYLDKKYKISTKDAESSYIDSINTDNKQFAIPYEPIQYNIFKRMMDDISINPEEYIFIDLGSGKGRALIYATRYHFKNIIGVEFSEELHFVANSNINRFLSNFNDNNNIQLFCMDAVEYSYPEGNLLIFLYNPFVGRVMEEVIENIVKYINSTDNNVVILYRNPQCAYMFDRYDCFQKVCSNNSYNIYIRK